MPKRILIVDNYSAYLKELEIICRPALTTIVKAPAIDLDKLEGYDVVVLSGGDRHSVDDELFLKEIELIKQIKVPILGVCLGMQIIAHAFGTPLRKLPHRVHGIVKIQPTPAGRELLGTEIRSVYENHRWVVSEVPRDFQVLATSKDGIEALKHESLPITGFQFHPEVTLPENDGQQILNSVLAELRT